MSDMTYKREMFDLLADAIKKAIDQWAYENDEDPPVNIVAGVFACIFCCKAWQEICPEHHLKLAHLLAAELVADAKRRPH